MTTAEFHKHGVNDARLAIHATSHLPAWLWSLDGAQVLWANPVGAAVFGARTGLDMSSVTIGPADARRRQIMQLVGRLRPDASVRIERLRAFGAPFGGLLACACSRLDFADGRSGVLIVAVEAIGRVMPLIERLQRLVEGNDTPMAAFGRDGLFVGASEPARALVAFRSLSDAGLDAARTDALRDGRIEMPIGVGQIVLQRVGSGADVGLVALLAPGTTIPMPTSMVPPSSDAQHDNARPEPDMSEADHTIGRPAASEPNQVAALSSEPQSYTDAADDSGDLLVEPLAEPGDAKPSMVAAAEISDSLDKDMLKNNDEPSSAARAAAWRNPLRFTWAIDAANHFTVRSDDFTRLIGRRMAAGLDRPWPVIAGALQLDPEQRVAMALNSHNTWSGITLDWPVDPPGDPLPVEMAGLPVFDAERRFSGYRGFGVVRDLDALGRLDAIRNHIDPDDDDTPPRSLSAHASPAEPAGSFEPAPDPQPIEPNVADAVQALTAVPMPPPVMAQNVVPIRPLTDQSAPVLSPVENNAFNELAMRLAARLNHDDATDRTVPRDGPVPELPTKIAPAAEASDWLSRPTALAQGMAQRDRPLLDLLPVGVLVYRLDRLLYANPHFLDRVGHSDLMSLETAGGLDALYVEPSIAADSDGHAGTAVTIATKADTAPAAAHLSPIAWDGEPALALIFDHAPSEPSTTAEPDAPIVAAGHPNVEELATILDNAAEGIVMFDVTGTILSCNRSAEALFGRDGATMTRGSFADLFAPDSQRAVQDDVDAAARADASQMHGREVLGRLPSGELVPLAITIGRTLPNAPNFFAIVRDQSQTRKNDTELLAARKQADRFVSAKTDLLARISHEVRTPLNAIIGFSDVMIEERFGALGNPRYGDYIKDIRGCGERVVAIIDDLLDLAKIETGVFNLAFASQNLNEMIEQCVAVMQPQANRERIIIRTSLAHHLPTVHADARALRQIATNLISNSIHLANPGGQVIVSTALSDLGHVVLRVRDTGHGLNDNEIAQAMEPFRTRAPTDCGPETAAVNLSLTRALVEANRAQFTIKTAPQTGTLIEIVFGALKASA